MNNLAVLSPSHSKPDWPIPTREEVLGVNMHFRGGIVVDSSEFGKMPWWPSALSWCNPTTRKEVYKQMREVGDTHAMIEIPNGFPLYNEGNQFYSPDKFGPLDWTDRETKIDYRLSDLVDEVISEGFKYVIEMDEGQVHSQRVIQLVMEALSDKQLKFGLAMPGYDAVFYGWPPIEIQRWAEIARSIKPDCYLGIEFNVGHIPVGNGPSDYLDDGMMSGFDLVAGEFQSSSGLHSDTTWQVIGRLVHGYKRPPDQPPADDPHPPFYLIDSARGARFFWAMETDYPYFWVRTDMNNQDAINNSIKNIEDERAYFASLGCKYIG